MHSSGVYSGHSASGQRGGGDGGGGGGGELTCFLIKIVKNNYDMGIHPK